LLINLNILIPENQNFLLKIFILSVKFATPLDSAARGGCTTHPLIYPLFLTYIFVIEQLKSRQQ